MSLYFNRKAMTPRRQELRNRATATERALWEFLRKRQVEGAKFRRQFSVGAYVLDFYCPELRLAIEVDGRIHNRPEIRKKDRIRQEAIERLKIRVLRFTNDEIKHNVEKVVGCIREVVRQS